MAKEVAVIDTGSMHDVADNYLLLTVRVQGKVQIKHKIHDRIYQQGFLSIFSGEFKAFAVQGLRRR